MKKKAYISKQPNNKMVYSMSEYIHNWTPQRGYYHVGFNNSKLVAIYSFSFLQKNVKIKYVVSNKKIQKVVNICLQLFEDRKRCIVREYTSIFPNDALFSFKKEVEELLKAPLLEDKDFFAFQAIRQYFSLGPAIKRVRDECVWFKTDSEGFYYPDGSC